jgi:hypothetical protein
MPLTFASASLRLAAAVLSESLFILYTYVLMGLDMPPDELKY